MATKKKAVKPTNKENQEVKTEGCEHCNNTGLKDGNTGYEAVVCPECNGSPYGA